MKKMVSVALTLCLVLFAGNAYGQQTEKQKKVKEQKEIKVQKSEGEKVMEKEAYGRNKGGLEGKEFGQARAADAKAMRRAKARRDRAHKIHRVNKGR